MSIKNVWFYSHYCIFQKSYAAGAKLNLIIHMINNAILSKYCTAVSMKYKPSYIICLMCFNLFILIHPVRNFASSLEKLR